MSHAFQRTSFSVLAAITLAHLINDMLQALLPAMYPILKSSYQLDFWQVGLITLANQLTASLLQPAVGLYTDRRPQPYLLAAGMGFTLVGIVLLSVASRFGTILTAAACVGIGSSVFHPESSRIARIASGGRHGFAQSLFQTGGNSGSSLGPLLAAFVVVPRGQSSLAWFAVAAAAGIGVLWQVGHWYSKSGGVRPAAQSTSPARVLPLPRAQVVRALAILLALVCSKLIYLTSLSSYYTFYLIERFDLTVRDAQLYLFLFLAAAAAGTFAGGPIGDRFGRKFVIWVSILGVLPLTMAMPYVGLQWTAILSVAIGLILSSAFSAILVYAQELVPGRVGLVSGLFFGTAFGVGGIGAAVLGRLADHMGIEFVYHVCAFLPAIGLLTAFLPNLHRANHAGMQKS